MEKQKAEELLDKYLQGNCTAEEKKLVEHTYNLLEQVSPDAANGLDDTYWKSEIYGRIPVVSPVRLWPRIAAAASIVLVIGIGTLYYVNRHKEHSTESVALKNDIVPGKHGATLTLANGSKIRLSDAANGQLAQQAGVTVSKLTNGQLVYEIKLQAGTRNDLGAINTLSTARGETYQVLLPDGSKVWLNAASSLTYAANLLQGGKRSVELRGEGYFEVAKDKAHPFIVATRGQKVEVLGTHFNINAYEDESAIKTTLLEGSVIVTAQNSSAKLRPGFEAVNHFKDLDVKEADLEVAVAWKNDQFLFESQDIKTIMRMISRWYDVDVIYEGEITSDTFSGGVPRFDKLSKILKSLESTKKISFRVEGRKLYVRK